MNHFVPSSSGESFISIDQVRKCKVDNIEWHGRDVYLGLDMAKTDDNVSVSMVSYDYETETILVKSWAFIPTDRITEKNNIERTDYNRFIREGNCFDCGNDVISYTYVENFIMEIQEKYGVNVIQVGYDWMNCLSTAGKLDEEGMTTVEVKQHSKILHRPTKLLHESILKEIYV